MNLRLITVEEGGKVSFQPEFELASDWHNVNCRYWLIVEGASENELKEIFESLDIDSGMVANHISGDHWMDFIDSPKFFLSAQPAPSAWRPYGDWFQLLVTDKAIVSIHPREVPPMQSFVKRWWLDRPGPEKNFESIMLHVVQSYIDEEILAFKKLRLRVEEHAFGLKEGNPVYSVEHLEAMMTEGYHISILFHESKLFLEGLQFVRTQAVELNKGATKTFQLGTIAIQSYYDGIEQLRQRMDSLQQQHIMDQQGRMDSRFRVLTIISAIFLPLTLIAGIYGMNFPNMPEFRIANSYYLTLVTMVVLGGGMMVFFYLRGWFR